jgi:hypothetical protein
VDNNSAATFLSINWSTYMLGMSIGSTIALCVAFAFVVSLLISAIMFPRMTQKRREFRRRGLS